MPGTTLKVIDDEGNALPLGERGELCVKGPQVMKGYWQRPEDTAQAIDADGWMHSGDLASMDEDGSVRIEVRIKDLVIRGGENIYPSEVEGVIGAHPKVKDVRGGVGAVAGVQLHEPAEAMAMVKKLRAQGVSGRAAGLGTLQYSPALITTDEQVAEIAAALDKAKGNISLAARMLGLSRAALYRKLGYREVERYNDNPYAQHWFAKDL